MKVLIVASECAPLVKVGGIADVIGSLPIALKNLGIDVRVVIPYYKPLKDALNTPEISSVDVLYGEINEKVTIHETQIEGGVKVYLLGNDKYIGNGGIYFSPQHMSSPEEELERFAFFSKAVCKIFSYQNDTFYPEVLHCNDWHTGLIPQILQTMHNYDRASIQKTIFTIHNLAYQGFTKLETADKLGLDVKHDQTLRWDAADDNLDMVLQGIVGADFVTTVSEKYSEEIQTKEYGEGLQDILESRKNRLTGILNGISYEVFNPSKDTYIKAQYTSANWKEGKAENKKQLQADLGLNQDPSTPIVGIISRLAAQKGLNLVSDSVKAMCDIGCQVVLLGTGDPQLEAKFQEYNNDQSISGKYKGLIEFSEQLARKIYASSDMFLIPSKYEPCGLTQMIAMKYGSVPIVRATGGLFDTVEDSKTGITFTEFSSKELISAVQRAYDLYSDKEAWAKIVTTCMSEDFSWDVSAKKYAMLYKKILSL